MREPTPQLFLDEVFERIEETILPLISMLLDTLIDAAAGIGESDPMALAAEIRTLTVELEGMTQAVERASPVQQGPEERRLAVG